MQQEDRPPSIGQEFLETVDTRIRILLSVAVDGVLIFAGLLIQSVLQRLADRLALHGIAYWYWIAVEGIIAVASIAIVVLYVVNDVWRVYRRLFPKGADR